jgi:hypothetical protein
MRGGGRRLGPVGEISSDVDWLWEYDVFGLDALHQPVLPPLGRVLIDQQNLGHVEWWTWNTVPTLQYGFRFDVVAPPPVLDRPQPRPPQVNGWTTYGDQQTEWKPASGTIGPYGPGALWFSVTDQGVTWYMQLRFASTSTPGLVRWFRPSGSPPWLFADTTDPGPAGTFVPLASAVTLPPGYLTLVEPIPVQPPAPTCGG